jgi:hypothetical protein
MCWLHAYTLVGFIVSKAGLEEPSEGLVFAGCTRSVDQMFLWVFNQVCDVFLHLLRK